MLKIYQLERHHNTDNANIAYANNFLDINDLEYTINNVHESVEYNWNKCRRYYSSNIVLFEDHIERDWEPFSLAVVDDDDGGRKRRVVVRV